MNSYSRNYEDYEPCRKEKEREEKETFKCECRKEKKEVCPLCPTIIKCGASGSASIPAATPVGTTFTPASLTLNTSCLCNPCTKIEVTSNVVTTAFTGTLSFQVVKQCRNQFTPVPVGPAFTYSQVAGTTITDARAFSFFICDCDSCDHDCCTYSLVVTVTAVTVGAVALNNVALGAISTCSFTPCCR